MGKAVMNCSECQLSLQLWADGIRGEENLAIERHLAVCPNCRDWQLALSTLQASLQRLPRSEVPGGLASRIVHRALSERRSRRWRYQVLVLAASFVLAILLGSVLNSAFKDDKNTVEREPQTKNEPIEFNTPEGQPSLKESVTNAGSAVVSLSMQAKEETRFLWSIAWPPIELSLPQPKDKTPSPWLEMGKGVSSGLEPVTDHAFRALDLFLHEVPSLPSSSKKG